MPGLPQHRLHSIRQQTQTRRERASRVKPAAGPGGLIGLGTSRSGGGHGAVSRSDPAPEPPETASAPRIRMMRCGKKRPLIIKFRQFCPDTSLRTRCQMLKPLRQVMRTDEQQRQRPSSSCKSHQQSVIWALTETSSAETASSQMIRSAPAPAPGAVPIRCRYPPGELVRKPVESASRQRSGSCPSAPRRVRSPHGGHAPGRNS